MKKIKSIMVDQIGLINCIDGEITTFLVNGEMAHVVWFQQGNKEFNGKYVIEIEYQEANET